MADTYDLFICHTGEDKARFVEPLVAALVGQGLTVWYDRFAIGLGDDFRLKMNEGLRGSRFGVAVVSPYSFKYWPQTELSALFNQEAHRRDGTGPRVLPVRCDLTQAELTDRDPLLAGRRSIGWDEGVDAIARQIAQVVRSQSPAPIARSPVYNVPRRRAQVFVGRDLDLDRLDAALRTGGPIAVSASIEGLAGVGKTELALRMVDRLSATDRFPGGIFWFEAERPDLTPIWGDAVADALAIGSGPVAERAKAALRVVATGGPALLVLDNVASWTRSNMPGPLPSGTHVAVLVTTRERMLGGPQAFAHVAIECLAPTPARALLEAVAVRDLDREPGVDDLLAHLDGHALAIELAGAFLAESPEVNATAYLSRLRAGEPVEDNVRHHVHHERTVAQVLNAIWERLDVGARQAWQVAGELAHAEATLELLVACGIDEGARRALRRFHLLTRAGDRWSTHRLVREYGQRAGTTAEREQARRAFIDGCVTRSRQIDIDTGFRIYRSDRPHFDQAIELAGTVLAAAPGAHSLLLDRVGIGAQSAGDLPRARVLLEQALAADLKSLGDDHPDIATRRSNLAVVLKEVGDLPRAKVLLEQALASNLENLGDDHSSVATSRSNLAGALQSLGDLPRAKVLLEQALASDLKNLGDGHPHVAIRRSNLAVVVKALGDLPRAKLLLEQALASDLKSLGDDHPSVATRRSNLATVLQDLGDLPRAKLLLEQAVASDLRNFGDGHLHVATKRSNLAVVLRDLGDFPRAKVLLEQALASNLKNLGDDHPSVATGRANLATVLQCLGNLQGAKLLLEQALASDLKNRDDDHPSVAIRRSNLAGVLKALGDLPSAKFLFEQALASNRKNLGDDHPVVASRRSNLAAVLLDLGDAVGARREAHAALAIAEKLPAGSQVRIGLESAVTAFLRSDEGSDA